MNTSVFNTIGIISKCIKHSFISCTSFDIRLLNLYFLLYVQSTAVSIAVTRLTAALPRGGRTRARLTLTRKGEVGETEEWTLNNLSTCSLRPGNSVTRESITYFDLIAYLSKRPVCIQSPPFHLATRYGLGTRAVFKQTLHLLNWPEVTNRDKFSFICRYKCCDSQSVGPVSRITKLAASCRTRAFSPRRVKLSVAVEEPARPAVEEAACVRSSWRRVTHTTLAS